MTDGISSYLERYRAFIAKHSTDTTEVLRILHEEVDQGIQEKDVLIKNNKITVAGHPAMKHALFQKKESILRKIIESGIKGIVDIT
jgi:hypothetical protein